MPPISRRTFLVAGAGLVVAGPALLAACGGDDGGSGGGAAEGLALATYFAPSTQAAGRQRLIFGLMDLVEILGPERAPAELTVQFSLEGADVGAPVTAARHSRGLERPYYPFRTELAEPGTYTARAVVDGQDVEANFTVVPPEQVGFPKPGDRMVAVDTPTTTEPHGVDPICTREPFCDLHDVTLAEALGEGRPVAFLVATPAYCAQATCGPILDVLLSASADLRDRIRVVHAEVYTDHGADTYTPAVDAYMLPFEPCLYLADASGTIVDRLDVLFDEDETRDALNGLVALN